MIAVIFAGPLAALGTLAGAAAVPVVIHLLNRRRYRVVDWAAMRFLLAAQKQNVRRLKLEQWLLLATRALFLALVVFAMAAVTPWAEAIWQRLLPGAAVAEPAVTGRTHKIVVLDASLSMTVRGDAGTAFDRAKALAAELVKSSAAGDGFSVVTLAGPPQTVVPGPGEDAAKVAREIDTLRCTHAPADLHAALQMVEELLKRAPGKYAQREVYVFTDMQRATWTPPASPGGAWTEAWGRLQAQAQLVCVDVGKDGVENLAVTNLTLADPLPVAGTRSTVATTVHNFAARERTGVRVEFRVGRVAPGEPAEPPVVQQEVVAVPAGGTATVNFPYEFRAAGEYVFQARLDADALEADDVRSLTVTVRDALPVLLVDGKPAVERREQAATWLADALNPFPEGTRNPAFPAKPKVVGLAQFADPGTGDLTPYDCVFLCDVARLNEREVGRLETHLQRGGGLVVCLGPNVDLEAYNRLLFKDGQGLLPAKLVGVRQAPANGFFTLAAGEEEFQRPPLAAFAADNDRASLLGARFNQYVRLELPAASPARKLLSIAQTGDALVVEQPKYRGRVVVVASTVNADWTSWPVAPTFPPFAQELLRFAVLQPPRRTVAVGEPLDELLSASVLAAEATIRTPDGRTETVPLKAEPNATRMRFHDTDQSGLYRATLPGDKREIVFAVNVTPGTEGDPRRLTAEELQSLTLEQDVQVVSDPSAAKRVPKRLADSGLPDDGPPVTVAARGPGLARIALLVAFALLVAESVLAWRFGSARSGRAGNPEPSSRRLDATWAVVAFGGLGVLAAAGAILLHAAWTDDFLGFVPDALMRPLGAAFRVPDAAPGEGTRWRLEFLPYLTGVPATDRWFVGALGVTAVALAVWLYARELPPPRRRWANVGPLTGLRLALILLSLGLLLPQVKLLFEREGWPDLVLMIDDSQSMSHVDDFQDPRVRAKADELAKVAGLTRPQRLQLAQALLARDSAAWLDELLRGRQAKLHIFHCSNRFARLGEASVTDAASAADAVRDLKADGPASNLGDAVRAVLQEFRGASLAGVVLLTDGVTTDGDDLVAAAGHAARAGVPLYLVGVGDGDEPRDLYLHDLQVEDAVHVQDRLVFEARLTAKGNIAAASVPVILYEKRGDRLKELKREQVALDRDGKPARVRLTHTPTEAGERTYVIEVPRQPGEVEAGNNRLERQVFVSEFQRTRVLYVEGYPRYEYRFLKALLERESTTRRANKTVDLKVLLLDADPDYPKQDRAAVESFPAVREELFTKYDLVILGDVDPRHPKVGEKHLQWLADFAKEKGGGLLTIAGPQHMPASYRDTPLADVLPVEVPLGYADEGGDRPTGFRLRLTPVGLVHPMFRFSPDEAENQAIWDRLAPLYWSAGALKPKPAAEVLAVKPVGAGGVGGEPLIVQQFAGAGRSMFFGFDESWRWRFREDELRYNQFWVQAVRYLGRTRLGRIDLRLDKQVPYRRGEPVRVTVRFPDDVPPPPAETQVQVTSEYVAPGGEVESQTLRLARLEGSRGTYEAVLPRTSEGQYRFRLASPTPQGPKPQAAARVLPPPGEMDRLQLNKADLERAALVSRGKFYTLADAERLPRELPELPRVTLHQPRPPWTLWNHPLVFAAVLACITGEWLLRKRHSLL